MQPQETSKIPAPISAYIRTKNEARLIGDVVRAALQIASEVVVIDSGSGDDTIAIAEQAGARVVRHDWAGYGHQKRIAEDLCTHHWLLDLDGDEIVTPALADEIAALFANGAEPPFSVYNTPMAIAPPFGPVWRKFGLQPRTKFYDKRVIRMPAHEFWDQFKIPADITLGKINEPIHHYAVADADHLMSRLNKYSTDRAISSKRRPQWLNAVRIIFGLPFYFVRRYFLEGFFRGGVYGFAYALMTAFRRWLVDIKRYEIGKIEDEQKNSPENIESGGHQK